MVITIPLAALIVTVTIAVLGGAASLIGVYNNLNTKITKLESQVSTNTKTIEKMDNIIYNELKEIKELINKMNVELQIQKNINNAK